MLNMPAIQFCLDAYSAFTVSLMVIGFISTLYLFGIKDERPASRLIALGVAGFTLGVGVVFLRSIIFWGGALAPLADGFAVLSMAAVLGFVYHFPQRDHSFEAHLVLFYAVTVTLIAFGYSTNYAYQVVVKHRFGLAVAGSFWWLNPITFFSALLAMVRRTFQTQRQKSPEAGAGEILALIIKSDDRQVRVLRNYAYALFLGLGQGLVYIPPVNALILPNIARGIGQFSLLLTIVAVVYGSFELPRQSPGLIVRLVGISLVSIPVILGFLSIFIVNAQIEEINQENIEIVDYVSSAVQDDVLLAVPEDVAYIIAWPVVAFEKLQDASSEIELLYENQIKIDVYSLIAEQRARTRGDLLKPIWTYLIEKGLGAAEHDVDVIFRYGNHPWGSYYQYAGYLFTEGETRYEIGFNLTDLNSVPHRTSTAMVIAVLVGGLGVVTVYPLLFRTSLIKPLERLLTGVRQLNNGELDVYVPALYQDEIGFLTETFNKMVASLSAELKKRHQAEEELRAMTSSLEQRVIARTRDLSVLYDLSTIASREIDIHTMLVESLTRTLNAFACQTGAILLKSEDGFQVAVQHGLSAIWNNNMDTLFLPDELLNEAIGQKIPMLFDEYAVKERLSGPANSSDAINMLLAPLTAAGQRLGVMLLAREVENSFDLDEVALAASISDQIGMALHSERLREKIQDSQIMAERQRLARDLHDSITQSLYGVATLTGAGKVRLEKGDHAGLVKTFDRIGQTVRQAIREMRLFIHQLRPSVLEEEGLVNALNLRLAAVEGRSDVRAHMIAEDGFELPASVETAFFFIAQEALNNTLKHASAEIVDVNLYRMGDSLMMEVSDNGRGFDPAVESDGGMGLENMRKRANEIGAQLDILSSPGEGTTIKVSLNEGDIS